MATRRFPTRLDPRARGFLRLFGVHGPEDAWVDLDDTTLTARFGRFDVSTPVSAIVGWRIEGPWNPITALGVRRSVRHGDITFGGSSRGGLRLDLREAVRVGPFHPTTLYVTPEDVDGLGAALAALGVPGRDARTGA
jgi:hypothetical protein